MPNTKPNKEVTQLPPGFYQPKYWGEWIAIGLLRLTVLLPHSWLIRVGRMLGRLVYKLAKNRRHVARVNIDLCFPELSESARQQLVQATVEESVIGFLEGAYAWWGRPKKLLPQVEVIGLEHIRNLPDHCGAILIGAHYTNLDLGGVLATQFVDLDVIYRPNDNPVLNWMINSGRAPYFGKMIEKNDIRDFARRVKQGNIVWYPADQDYGREGAVYVPFFGVCAATLTATSRLAKICKAPVLFIAHHRHPTTNHYIVEFTPVLDNFPSDDVTVDTARVNYELEQLILKYPQQYMWVHRRFKTQQDENASGFY